MYDLHNVINRSLDVNHVLVLSYYLVNNKICLKQKNRILGNCNTKSANKNQSRIFTTTIESYHYIMPICWYIEKEET